MDTPVPPTSPPPSKPKPARSVFARTTDILVISLLLTVSLTTGRQIIDWWHDDPTTVTAPSPSTPAWGESGEPVELQFGAAPGSLTRQVVQGDRAVALRKLTDRCAEVTANAPQLTAGKAEERSIIETLLQRKPVAEKEGRWRVYSLEGPFEMVIGLQSLKSERPRDAESWRIVCSGSLLPAEKKSWALHLFTAHDSVVMASGTETIPLPPGARRLMSLGESGQRFTGFTVESERECMQFYDRWFAHRGWTNFGWQSGNRTWTARFAHDAPPTGDQSKTGGSIVYIQLTRVDKSPGLDSPAPAPHSSEQVMGLLTYMSAPVRATESTRN